MKKPTVKRSTESKTVRELRALLAHADEVIRSLSRQSEEATKMAVSGYYQRHNEVLKNDR